MTFLTILFGCLALSCTAKVLYERSYAPAGWTQGARASHDEAVTFTVALKQQNLDQLEKLFWEVSEPSHPSYRQYLTVEQINEMTAPKASVTRTVVEWLSHHGVKHHQIKNYVEALTVSTTVQVAERLFSTSFFQYTHEDGRQITRAHGAYSVPESIAQCIELVTGLSYFPIDRLSVVRDQSNVEDPTQQGVVPQTLTSIYGIRATTPNAALNTSQAVVEFEGQNFAPADLTMFSQQTNVPIASVTAAHTIGPNDPTNPGVEAELDIQMQAGVNNEASSWFWIMGDPSAWLYEFGTQFIQSKSVPQVLSISYAWSEDDQCDIDVNGCSQLGVDTYGYARAVNVQFQKIGLRGISVLVASGDSGCHGRTDYSCQDPRFHPDFPSSSPYVTSVGATQLVNLEFNLKTQPPICAAAGLPCPSGGTEVAVSIDVAAFASGGGFSNVAPTPAYQLQAVQGYLKSGVKLPASSFYNASGRGAPDVSAIGFNTLIISGGAPSPVSGTSAATPIFSGVISLLNQASIAKSGATLGFLNPLLYRMSASDPTTFTDVTVGDNICTEQGCSASCVGFYAYKGWDPVTGLGTPNFPSMLKYVQSL